MNINNNNPLPNKRDANVLQHLRYVSLP